MSLHTHLRVSCSLFPGRPGYTQHFLCEWQDLLQVRVSGVRLAVISLGGRYRPLIIVYTLTPSASAAPLLQWMLARTWTSMETTMFCMELVVMQHVSYNLLSRAFPQAACSVLAISPLPPASLASPLATHRPQSNPAVSAMTMNLVTDVTATPAPPVVIVPPVSFSGHFFSILSRSHT